MYELNQSNLLQISGGRPNSCPEIPEENREYLTAGAHLGLTAGLAYAMHSNAPLAAYPFFMLQGHLVGMVIQYGAKFTRLFNERRTTGNRCIVPFVDAFTN